MFKNSVHLYGPEIQYILLCQEWTTALQGLSWFSHVKWVSMLSPTIFHQDYSSLFHGSGKSLFYHRVDNFKSLFYHRKLLKVLELKDCKRNFKWPSMQRWQRYPWNLNLIKTVEDKIIFSSSKSVYFCQFFHYFLKTRNAQVIFAEKPQMKMNF